MDIGPLGLGNIAAHGHADALSVYLSVAGREILIDPGTYAYHTEQKWRNYFRGTAAHNTIRIDNEDQSQIGGNFMWLRKAQATLETYEDGATGGRLVGSHDGYRRLPDPVSVTREVIFSAEGRQFILSDMLSCRRDHRVEQFWHFNENATVERTGDFGFLITHDSVKVQLTVDPQVSCELKSGDPTGPAGWVSRSFDNKQPTTTIIASATLQGGTELKTIIEILDF
jgi:hypothetical protein